MATAVLLTIGQLAREARVSAQTLRHYDRIGLLKPTVVLPSGYRRYDEAARARLATIRSLRALAFDLETIRTVLDHGMTAEQAATAHLGAVDAQLGTLHQYRAALLSFLRRDPEESELAIAQLVRIGTLAQMSHEERISFVRQQLEMRLRQHSNDFPWPCLTEALLGLPTARTLSQWEAWFELASLVSDAAFLSRFSERTAGPSASLRAQGGGHPWADTSLVRKAASLLTDGVDPEGAEAGQVVGPWLQRLARETQDDEYMLARRMLASLEVQRRSGEERFWELLAALRPELASSPLLLGRSWLRRSLRVFAMRAGPE